jgi:membrane protein
MDGQQTKTFARELVSRFQADDATGAAAELGFRFLFAIFPFGIFLAALGAFVAAWMRISNPAEQIIAGLGDNLPPELASSLRPELERVIGQSQPGVMSLGALLALWAATSGTMTVMKVMNRAYGVSESRPLLARYGLGIALTVVGAAGLLFAFVTIVGGSLLTERVAAELGVGGVAWTAISLLRWPAVFGLLAVGVAVLYRVGPNFQPTWRSAFIGSVLFAAGWLIATFGFGLYVGTLGNYGATYGTLAGVIVLMLWLYLTALVLVIGAEIVAVRTRLFEQERLQERQVAIEGDAAALDGGRSARTRQPVTHRSA